MANSIILKGDICCSIDKNTIATKESSYVICEDGICKGIFKDIPEKYKGLPIKDFKNALIIPGLVDLHTHAPQYAFRGLGMDLELLDWLKKYTFPEEAKYANLEYAEKAYSVFVEQTKMSATTRAVIFATVHRDATILLMDKLEKAKINCYVGKVNMDRDAPDDLREPGFLESAFDTFGWINEVNGKYKFVKPILTPRFLPSCSDALLQELKEIQKAYDIPVQSHLSENPSEVELVHNLFPKAAFYGDGYDSYNLFGNGVKTVMAHCIYSTEEEIKRMKDNGVFVAHCPASNMNLCSGIAPIKRYMEENMRVGLGSDVAGGECESIFRAIKNAIQVSKLYTRLINDAYAPLGFEEAFYLATIGGGEFFGKVGTFKDGYEFDAIVLDDKELYINNDLSLRQRLERDIYLEADAKCIIGKYVNGCEVIGEN